MRSSRIALVWVFATALGCGGSVEEPNADAFVSPDADGAVTITDTTASDTAPVPLDIGPMPDAPIVVDEGPTCTPPETVAGFGFATCCNSLPCAGQCIEVAGGKHECQCFGILGGCDAPQVCCRYGSSSGCTDKILCER